MRGPCALPPGSRLLIAVSGGADSTALLLGLHSLASEHGLVLHAAHLHHGLRGADADADFDFVHALCAAHGVPLAAARWDCRARMRRRGLTGQAGLRTLRREFLIRAATLIQASAIATAHTADDQLETMLMRLTRGGGLAGLSGMNERRGRWLKPLLDAPRADIEADLRAIGQTWREDRTNLDPRYFRSRVRLDVIPALVRSLDPEGRGRAAPGPDSTRARLARKAAAAARELRDARRLVARQSARILARVASIQGSEITLDSHRLGFYPPTIQRAVLRLLWQRPGHAEHHLSQRHLNALLSLIATTRGGSRVDLPGGWRAERDRGNIILSRGDRARSPAIPA